MKFVRLKCLQKFCYDLNYNKITRPICHRFYYNGKLIFYLLGTLLIIFVIIFFIFMDTNISIFDCSTSISEYINSKKYTFTEPIDVVYTWVNGSDPEFIKEIQKYQSFYDPSRFDDKHELKYSLRSLEKYAPWVRHIYIVTNGQIPDWLDLENKHISIVTHHELTPNVEILPTFSSAAIETFIHRIPNLSRQFLYLNDDIFIGKKLYPDDLYTMHEGYKIWTAWTLPDCAPNCPWAYIGDGSCDDICNIEQCQFDGGDCDPNRSNSRSSESSIQNHRNLLVENQDSDLALEHNDDVEELKKEMNFFVDIPKLNQKGIQFVANFTNSTERDLFVQNYNDRQQKRLKSIKRRRKRKVVSKENVQKPKNSTSQENSSSSKDMFAKSLIHTNRMFNRIYGFKSRKVISHVGFLLNIDIIDEMLNLYSKEFEITQSHRFRDASDMQYAFTYYHHLMEQTHNLTIEEIFDEYDTDKSGTWSDREIRTLLARIYKIPLDWGAVRYFESVIGNCSVTTSTITSIENILTSHILYERYEDSNIPTITKELIAGCKEISEALRRKFATRSKYKFTINSKGGMDSNFKMLTSNVSQVVDALDEIRRTPKKFNCINDNLDSSNGDDNQLILAILDDFYLSLFPKKSRFELPDNYRNRFRRIIEYYSWRDNRFKVTISVTIFCICMFIVGLKLICFKHKIKYVNKCIV